jgi:hypothetical protein
MTTHEFTIDRVMFFATGPGGLAGECRRIWPQSYLDTHIVENDGWTYLNGAKGDIVAALVARGWLERTERHIEVPADTDRYSMFYGNPAHTLVSVAYMATDKGRAEWAKG